jgi:transcriptional regulator with XRE-family HTH domain
VILLFSKTVREYIRITFILATLIQEVPKVDFTIAAEMPAKKPAQTAFGKRMVALRQARGLTQIELAKAAETTQRAISYYETEAEFPIASALIPLARALRVTTDELLGVKPAKLDQGKPRSRRLWKRFQRMASLPERDQRAVIRLINSLATSNGNGQSHSSHP